MNSQEIWGVISAIATERSTSGKEAILFRHKDDEEFKRVLEFAYNPFKIYGIKKVPSRHRGLMGGAHFDTTPKSTWILLQNLIDRSLTGNAARDAIQEELNILDEWSATVLTLILKKDLRCGISEKTINKVIKGLIPTTPYMRCSLPKDVKLDKFDWKTGVISQEKADGMFANITYESQDVCYITSRQGSLFPSVPKFDVLLEEVKTKLALGNQYHGELLVVRDMKLLPREQSNGVLNSVLKGGDFDDNEWPVYQVWDMVWGGVIAAARHDSKATYSVPYAKRLSCLVKLLNNSVTQSYIYLTPTRVVHSIEDARKHCLELLSVGKEGTIFKDPHAVWKSGTSRWQVKLKMDVCVDLEVIGFVPGNGKNEDTFGSILCATSDSKLEVAVSGFSDPERADFWKARDSVIGKIMTVRVNSIMYSTDPKKPNSLFLPRFVEFREDKLNADTFQQVVNQFESAVKAA